MCVTVCLHVCLNSYVSMYVHRVVVPEHDADFGMPLAFEASQRYCAMPRACFFCSEHQQLSHSPKLSLFIFVFLSVYLM